MPDVPLIFDAILQGPQSKCLPDVLTRVSLLIVLDCKGISIECTFSLGHGGLALANLSLSHYLRYNTCELIVCP